MGKKLGSWGGIPWERSGGPGAAAPGKEVGVRVRQPLGKKRGSGGGSPWEKSGGAGAAAPGNPSCPAFAALWPSYM